jgi:D-glycero-alpha-D-manno-heptose-7-phosphate kinase
VNVKSPTRIDLAGGTLDCWPLYAFLGPSVTVNLAIDIYTEVTLEDRQDSRLIIESEDQNLHHEFPSIDALKVNKDPQLGLVRVVASYFQVDRGFHLKMKSDSPVGGGLGGSSSLVISLIKAFARWTHRIVEPERAVRLASNLEAQMLRTPTGTQDYYPAIYGGLNFIYYGMDEVRVECWNPHNGFDEHIVLVYTGRSHSSGVNNWQVIQSAVAGDSQVLEALMGIQVVAEKLTVACKEERWDQMGELFRQESMWRLRLTPAFSSPEIEQLVRISEEAGAEAIKICGAGGGGCVLLWCPPERKSAVVDLCQKNQYQVLKAKSVDPLVVNAQE